jgi:hypothetical protein
MVASTTMQCRDDCVYCVMIYCVVMTMYCHGEYGLSWIISNLILCLLNVLIPVLWPILEAPILGGSQNRLYIKKLTKFLG